VATPDGKKFDVIFIGTDNGKVIKTLNAASFDSSAEVSPVVIEEIQVLPNNIPVKNLYVVRMPGALDTSKLVVVSDDEIQAIKLHRCGSDKITSCRECVALQDPYCAWSVQQKRCVAGGSAEAWSAAGGRFLQSVVSGEHPGCGVEGEISHATVERAKRPFYLEFCSICVFCMLLLLIFAAFFGSD